GAHCLGGARHAPLPRGWRLLRPRPSLPQGAVARPRTPRRRNPQIGPRGRTRGSDRAMTVITHNRRRSRLSTLVDQPGGVSVGVALAQAQANLAELEARSREIIKDQVAALAALPAPVAIGDRVVDQAYAHASAVIDAAGPCGLDALCTAATNLCDLIDAAPEDRPFDWRVVTVHAQA